MSAFVTHLTELMRPWAQITARRMFGGHGLYRDGLMFGLVADELLYLKIDAATRDTFEAAGCRPFVYDGKGKPIEMSYWTVPAECLESATAMRPWCTLAYAEALRAQAGKPKAADTAKSARQSAVKRSRR
jgi:DNA transformation protein